MKIKFIFFSIALLVILCIGACKNKQNVYKISGSVTNSMLKQVFLLKIIDVTKIDTLATAPVVNGVFQFSGSVKEPQRAFIKIGRLLIPIILENEEFTVTMNEKNSYVKGGKINTIAYAYKYQEDYLEASKKLFRIRDSVFRDIYDESDLKKARLLSSFQFKIVRGIAIKYQRKILEGDYPVMAKLFVLEEFYDWETLGVDDRLALCDKYEKEIGKNDKIDKLRYGYIKTKEKAEKRKSVSPGSAFKEVLAKDIKGEEIRLSEVIARNKYTLLEIWASWCGPCRGEFPHLRKAYEKFHKKGFEIYGLSLDNKKEDWMKALEEENVPWINIVDLESFNGKAVKDYGISGVPSSFLISNDGIIVASMQEVRGSELDKKLEELFKE